MSGTLLTRLVPKSGERINCIRDTEDRTVFTCVLGDKVGRTDYPHSFVKVRVNDAMGKAWVEDASGKILADKPDAKLFNHIGDYFRGQGYDMD